MMPLVNFHTHNYSENPDIIDVRSYMVKDFVRCQTNEFCTVGIHPWFANDDNIGKQIDDLNSILAEGCVIGVGEIGLDKHKGPSIESQKQVLVKQVELAYSYGKPIIIHCVKAWDNLLEVKNSFSDEIPWAIHGFNGNMQMVNQLVGAGFYLSVGAGILRTNSKIFSAIPYIPVNKLFIESDTVNIDIKLLYDKIAERIFWPTEKLENQIYNNFLRFFRLNI